ncbi:uncharacterized protein N7500_010915 [Penicillium coprophilum]|uniref:uncharacterized protein n=1 Tax=Penicillium coprophilum TaxID=36646 RepID=UPI00238716FC|nr:uncharacterized protein N7500_010915 [Penicillium coprophilum]KAJ5150726.1 hypothetical protein N7500_010915 [Penicillium coprophilum]
MEVQKKKSTLEHRRAQNRLAQRRFRQRQSQQKANADRPPQQTQTLEPPLSATNDPSDLFDFSGPRSTHQSPVKSPPGFGVNCLQGGANGLIGIQNFTNMDDLMGPTLSSLLAGPSPGISNTDPAEYTLFGSDRDSIPNHPGSLSTTVGSRSTYKTTPGIFNTNFLPKPLTNHSTPASARGASALPHGTAEPHNADSGWLSALHIAAQKGHYRIMRMLLEQDIDCNEIDGNGMTPLIHATIGGYEDVVTLLLTHGARIDQVDCQDRSALHFAVNHRREAILKILLDHCVGDRGLIDAYDSGGRTPLHIAVDTGFEAGVQALVQRGASVRYRTRKTLPVP